MIMISIFIAIIILVLIIFINLKLDSIYTKVGAYLAIGGMSALYLMTQGEFAREVVRLTSIDYAQFIVIPLITVFIASLGLFSLKIKAGTRIGWFLFLICPLVGNFGTTWALVPIGLSLVPFLKKEYPQKWLFILITMGIFSMNFMALGTLLADPPQAFWAIKAGLAGKPLGFFFPFTKFWPYLLTTLFVYFVTLRRIGVHFGNLSELLNYRPENSWKFFYGILLAGTLAYALLFLIGFQITYFLGSIFIVGLLTSRFFGHEAFHNTIHWSLETAAVFVAFFAVVAFVHSGLHSIHFENQAMTAMVIPMTMFADNAAAFAAAYPQFEPLSDSYMTWFDLHPAVAYGGVSPFGNGPQITLFLVILVALKMTKPGQVFKDWFIEASIFMPYLLVWTLSATTLIDHGIEVTVAMQFLIGIIASAVAFQAMDLQQKFRIHVTGDDWTGREHGKKA